MKKFRVWYCDIGDASVSSKIVVAGDPADARAKVYSQRARKRHILKAVKV